MGKRKKMCIRNVQKGRTIDYMRSAKNVNIDERHLHIIRQLSDR